MLSRLSQSLRQVARNFLAEKVGVDQIGNQYFKQPKVVDGIEGERRWVKFRGHPDPRTLPVEWTSWLSNTRPDPPTPQEIAELEEQRKLTKFKARLLEADEEKRRFRAKSLKRGMPAEDVRPEGMDTMMRQIRAPENAAIGSQGGFLEASSTERGSETEAAELLAGPTSRLQPNQRIEYWQPPEGHSKSEPSGQGPTFTPGAWTPDKAPREEKTGKGSQFEPEHWQPPASEGR